MRYNLKLKSAVNKFKIKYIKSIQIKNLKIKNALYNDFALKCCGKFLLKCVKTYIYI